MSHVTFAPGFAIGPRARRPPESRPSPRPENPELFGPRATREKFGRASGEKQKKSGTFGLSGQIGLLGQFGPSGLITKLETMKLAWLNKNSNTWNVQDCYGSSVCKSTHWTEMTKLNEHIGFKCFFKNKFELKIDFKNIGQA